MVAHLQQNSANYFYMPKNELQVFGEWLLNVEQMIFIFSIANDFCNKKIIQYIQYLRSTNFRGYIFSRISPFLAIFAKLNTREIFLDVKFAKITTHEKR